MIKEDWHLDKKVPITLVIMILFQTGGFVWWAATKSMEILELSHRTDKIETMNDQQGKLLEEFISRIGKIEERQLIQTEILTDIRSDLRSDRTRRNR